MTNNAATASLPAVSRQDSGFDAFRKKPSERRADALPGGELVALESAAAETLRRGGGRRAPRGGGVDLGDRVDTNIQLPTIVTDPDDVDAHDLRRAARSGKQARSSGRVGAILGVAIVAGAVVLGSQFLETETPSTTDATGAGTGEDAVGAETLAGAASADVTAVGTSTVQPPSDGAAATQVGGVVVQPENVLSAGDVQLGVVFVEKSYDLQDLPAGPALVVSGRVANNGPDPVPTPIIEVVTRDNTGAELNRFRAQPELVEALEVGQSAPFAARLMYPETPIQTVEFFFIVP